MDLIAELDCICYFSSHPGLHVSHIQKLMGHKWRNMTAEEQAPYRW